MPENFMLSREAQFMALSNQIKSRLAEFHEGKNVEYRQQVAILKDVRSRELLNVEVARGLALQRMEPEYDEEKRLADKKFQVHYLRNPPRCIL
jgi:hypothetical protein